MTARRSDGRTVGGTGRAPKPRERSPNAPAAVPSGGRTMLELLKRLKRAYPDAHCALDHRTPFELLVATILSAQCTDARVNMVTPVLFARYPTAKALAGARPEDVEALIRSTGFFHNKAKSLLGMSRGLEIGRAHV